MEQKLILNSAQISLVIERLACQIIENHLDFERSVLIGLYPSGIALCDAICKCIELKISKSIDYGYLDYGLYRDDLHLKKLQPLGKNKMNHNIEGKNVILIDDVLYTGRTIRASLDALMDYGRPNDIELLVLIDRRLHRNVPIQAKYIGATIDSIQSERVIVNLPNDMTQASVYMLQKSHE